MIHQVNSFQRFGNAASRRPHPRYSRPCWRPGLTNVVLMFPYVLPALPVQGFQTCLFKTTRVPVRVSHCSQYILVPVHHCAANACVIARVLDITATVVGVDWAFHLLRGGYFLVEVECWFVGAGDGILVNLVFSVRLPVFEKLSSCVSGPFLVAIHLRIFRLCPC